MKRDRRAGCLCLSDFREDSLEELAQESHAVKEMAEAGAAGGRTRLYSHSSETRPVFFQERLEPR